MRTQIKKPEVCKNQIPRVSKQDTKGQLLTLSTHNYQHTNIIKF